MFVEIKSPLRVPTQSPESKLYFATQDTSLNMLNKYILAVVGCMILFRLSTFSQLNRIHTLFHHITIVPPLLHPPPHSSYPSLFIVYY